MEFTEFLELVECIEFTELVELIGVGCLDVGMLAPGRARARSPGRSSYSSGSGAVVLISRPVRCRRWDRRHMWYDVKRTSWYQREAGRSCYGSYEDGALGLARRVATARSRATRSPARHREAARR